MCGKNGQLRCKPNKITRNGCKYCRYKRCRDNAGMVENWVLSAHTTEIQNEKNCQINKFKREERLKYALASKKTVPSTETESNMEIDPQVNAESFKGMSTKYRKSSLNNPTVI